MYPHFETAATEYIFFFYNNLDAFEIQSVFGGMFCTGDRLTGQAGRAGHGGRQGPTPATSKPARRHVGGRWSGPVRTGTGLTENRGLGSQRTGPLSPVTCDLFHTEDGRRALSARGEGQPGPAGGAEDADESRDGPDEQVSYTCI